MFPIYDVPLPDLYFLLLLHFGICTFKSLFIFVCTLFYHLHEHFHYIRRKSRPTASPANERIQGDIKGEGQKEAEEMDGREGKKKESGLP